MTNDGRGWLWRKHRTLGKEGRGRHVGQTHVPRLGHAGGARHFENLAPCTASTTNGLVPDTVFLTLPLYESSLTSTWPLISGRG